MTDRKSILLLASAATLTLAVHGSAWSTSAEEESAPPAAATPVTPQPATVDTPVPEPAPKGEKSAAEAAPASPQGTPPAASGPDATASESQAPMPETCRKCMGSMTPEERRAHRQQHFRKMREEAMKRRQKMTERWDSYWKILDAMTPEQKEAVQAIFGRGQKGCAQKARGRRTPPAMPMRPDRGQPDFGFPAGPAFPGPGYGYGPRGAQTGNSGDQEPPQAPNPPTTDSP